LQNLFKGEVLDEPGKYEERVRGFIETILGEELDGSLSRPRYGRRKAIGNEDAVAPLIRPTRPSWAVISDLYQSCASANLTRRSARRNWLQKKRENRHARQWGAHRSVNHVTLAVLAPKAFWGARRLKRPRHADAS